MEAAHMLWRYAASKLKRQNHTYSVARSQMGRYLAQWEDIENTVLDYCRFHSISIAFC
jgi:hypothetical protein